MKPSLLLMTAVISCAAIGCRAVRVDFSGDQPAAAPAATTTTNPVAVQPAQAAPTPAAPTPTPSAAPTPVAAVPTPTPSASPATRPYSAGFKTLYVTTQSGDPLNLRVSNSTSAAVVAALPYGSAVAPYAEDMSGEWYQVTAENGQRGWISASYVSRNAPAPVAAAPAPAAPPATSGGSYSGSKYRTVTMNSGTLNIRSVPGGGVIGSLNNGEDVQVLSESGAWVRIAAAGGREGWVAAQYLR